MFPLMLAVMICPALSSVNLAQYVVAGPVTIYCPVIDPEVFNEGEQMIIQPRFRDFQNFIVWKIPVC